MKKRCVAYCRVSTAQKHQLNSLKNQIQHYTELFQNNKDLMPIDIGAIYYKNGERNPLKHIFADEGTSAVISYKHRKAFNEMLECAN